MVEFVLETSGIKITQTLAVPASLMILISHIYPLWSFNYTGFSRKTQAAFGPFYLSLAVLQDLGIETLPPPAPDLHDKNSRAHTTLWSCQTDTSLGPHECEHALYQILISPRILKRHRTSCPVQHALCKFHADIY
jgi:hypothetical protein